jgi:hypothetical protein
MLHLLAHERSSFTPLKESTATAPFALPFVTVMVRSFVAASFPITKGHYQRLTARH